MTIPSRESYGGASGWADGRLGQAFDLIDAVLVETSDASEACRHLKRARDAVEEADHEIEQDGQL